MKSHQVRIKKPKTQHQILAKVSEEDCVDFACINKAVLVSFLWSEADYALNEPNF